MYRNSCRQRPAPSSRTRPQPGIEGDYRSVELRQRLTSAPVVELTEVELDRLRVSAETLRDEDTLVAGRIRILSIDGLIVVQEQTPQRRFLVRALPSLERAREFVDDRLAVYERMWDGCGCRVDYLG